ncbi:hypothetical protein SAY87_019840 [Trapa incisa]|uniref:Probable zinc-ribbon domain-containing protein n=1 Tax=Trapa incisa TaxID=236973 RepID=A0AAN7Q3J7_9MYRT|nr:hypothetical protein SAY87_019840 [Trapa incisa]
MDGRYASYGTGGKVSTRGARSRLPEKSTRDEGEYNGVNNRRVLNDPTLHGRFAGDDEEASLRSYGSVNHLRTRGGFRETSLQIIDRNRLWDARSSRSRNDQREDRSDQFSTFSRTPRGPQYQAHPPSYGYTGHTKSHPSASGTVPFDNLEAGRAELIWKLRRLNSHISRLKETEQRIPSGSRSAMVPADRYNGTYTHHLSTGRFMEEQVEYIDRREPLEQYPQDEFPPPNMLGSRKLPEDRFRHDGNLFQVRHVGRDPVEFKPGHRLQIHEIQSVKSSRSNSRSRGQAHGKIALASNKKSKHCVAVAGGAPILICSKCLNLLILPRRLKKMEKNVDKVKCGSCSTMLLLQFEEKRLIICIHESTQEEDGDRDSSAILNSAGNVQSSSLGLLDFGGSKSHDDIKHDLSMIKPEEKAISRERGVDEGLEEKITGGVTSSTPEEERELEEEMETQPSCKGMIIERNGQASSPALPSPTLETDPPIDSASKIACESQKDNEKASDDKNQQKAILTQGPLNQDSNITEHEASASECAPTSLHIVSMDTGKEEDGQKNKEGEGGSFNDHDEYSIIEHMMHGPIFEKVGPDVTINGHPILDDLVKRAEVQAGPILPGDYWYDYNAGFWGVMKHPCLGIIPPHIKEFKYPLPANCSRGNTGIFVNGRQLHEDDLRLLANRGLSMKRHQYYIVDIYGKVINDDTGREVCHLGLLAPTYVKFQEHQKLISLVL